MSHSTSETQLLQSTLLLLPTACEVRKAEVLLTKQDAERGLQMV